MMRWYLIKRLFLIAISILSWSLTGFAQYPFECKPAINLKKFDKWQILKHSDEKLDYTIVIPDFFPNHDPIKVKIIGGSGRDSCDVHIYKKNTLIKSFIEPIQISSFGPRPQSAFLEDVNGDGLKDLKILIPNNGCCGAYNFYAQVMYFFQNKNSTLTEISFQDLLWNYENRPERDFDGDGNFEIITQTFQNYGAHNYLLYNLYNFNGKTLANVNKKANYPIMIQLLWEENYKITNKISRAKMKTFTRKQPDDYSQK